MKTILICLSMFCVIVGCSKDNDDQPGSEGLEGVYGGTFSRTGMDTTTIRLELFSGRFSGYSDQYRYPAICGGSYMVNGNTIAFNDTCSWTPGYDPILNGSFNISAMPDNYWRIWRTQGNVTDEYMIRRLTR